MDRFKYVVIGNTYMILFSALLTHKEMKVLGNITSAGFVSRSNSTKCGFCVSGRSETLNLGPAEDDQLLLDLLIRQQRN